MNPELPQPGKMVPHFTLATSEGIDVRISQFRGRNNLVLIFAAGGWPKLILDLAGREEDLNEENAVVLVVQSSQRELSPRPPASSIVRVLCDPGGQISRRFGAGQSTAVYITDQYGEIYSAHRSSEGAPLPNADEVLASLRHVNAACPE